MRTPALFVALLLFAVGACAVPPPSTPASSVPPAPPTAPVRVAAPSPTDTTALAWYGGPPDLEDVSYGPHADHLGDLYLPTAGADRGVIITVHGGSFTGGSRGMIPDWFGSVMQQTERGFAVFNITYRLARGNTHAFPVGVQDVSRAVEWVRANGRRHGINPATVIVAGHSAGGTIAALVGVGHNASPGGALGRTTRVDGWLSIAGIHDFVKPGDTAAAALRTTWLGPNASSPTWAEAASAVRHLDREDPPGYVVHGDRDSIIPVGQAHALIDAARAAGVSSGLHYDIVSSGPDACRNHLPQCGMNVTAFSAWLDRIATGAL